MMSTVIGVGKEIAVLRKKARDGKLTLEDMAGRMFTMYVDCHGLCNRIHDTAST
ncbi:hypothetical protein K439DRAFT_1643243 [Ramaria rubella]|nr:hypothetical protein K439DRAFT_1643243 [Ramaria rubella]